MPETAQISSSAFLLIVVVATGLKLLLLPSYRSTDFEVHRNWLAITGTLPVSQWYLEETSEWTLDYPPLWAWVQCALARGAALVDPAMLELRAAPAAPSAACVAFQRGSVMLLDGLLLAGARAAAHAHAPAAARPAAAVLTLLSPGLLIVDHIHFQYNGAAPQTRALLLRARCRAKRLRTRPRATARSPARRPPAAARVGPLLGVLLLSLACARRGRLVASAALFAALLALKHLFLTLAPLERVAPRESASSRG